MFMVTIQLLHEGGEKEAILATEVHITFFRSDHFPADSHSGKDLSGDPVKDFAIFERSGFSFVGIADNEFFVARSIGGKLPFHRGRESCAPASAKARIQKIFQDIFVGLGHGLCQYLIFFVGVLPEY